MCQVLRDISGIQGCIFRFFLLIYTLRISVKRQTVWRRILLLQDLKSYADGQVTAVTPDGYYGADLTYTGPHVCQLLRRHIPSLCAG